MSEAIARVGPVALAPSTFVEAQDFAAQLAKAQGFIPQDFVGKPAAILAALMMGSELGIGAMESLRAIHVVKGRPVLSADLMLRLAMRAGVELERLRTDTEEAHARLTRPGRSGLRTHEHRFAMTEARAAGLAGNGTWKAYPAAMLRARCISAALRAWAPDVLGAGVYVEGEVEREPAPVTSIARAVEDADPAWRDEHDVHEGEPLPDEEPAAASPPPSTSSAACKLSDCDTAPRLDAWVGRYAVKVRAKSPAEQAKAIAQVIAQARSIGAVEEDIAAWRQALGGAPARTHDPDAGEVAPEEEP